jgi:hypothetical protein
MVPVEPTMEMLDEFDSIIDYGAEDSKKHGADLSQQHLQGDEVMVTLSGQTARRDAKGKLLPLRWSLSLTSKSVALETLRLLRKAQQPEDGA